MKIWTRFSYYPPPRPPPSFHVAQVRSSGTNNRRETVFIHWLTLWKHRLGCRSGRNLRRSLYCILSWAAKRNKYPYSAQLLPPHNPPSQCTETVPPTVGRSSCSKGLTKIISHRLTQELPPRWVFLYSVKWTTRTSHPIVIPLKVDTFKYQSSFWMKMSWLWKSCSQRIWMRDEKRPLLRKHPTEKL